MDERLLQKLGNVPVGGGVVEGGADQMTVTYVRSMRDEPLTLDQAKPQIAKLLMENKKTESYRNMIKQLRDKAKIEYVPPYSANGLALTLNK